MNSIEELKQLLLAMQNDINEIKTDMSGLKTDMNGLKTDMSGLKTDMSGLKTDVNGLKTDVNGLKSDVKDIKNQLNDMEAQNANRHIELNCKIEIIANELNIVEAVTKENTFDIAKLKAVK